MKEERPNIVLIMSDQHNANLMGCTGNKIIKTPNLDRLAANGIMFTEAHCPSPLCVPSRMAFMASKYPSEIEVWSNDCVLASDEPTFAHSLTNSGYDTALCGRMHFRGIDQFHGFQERIFDDCVPASSFLSPEILGSGFNRTTGQTKYAVEVAGYGKTGYQLFDRKVTDRACEYIKSHENSSAPFCLVTGMISPHNPLICRRDLFEYYYSAIEPADSNEKNIAEINPAIRIWRKRRKVDELTVEQNRRALAAYYGLITEMDENLGRILEAVDSHPKSKNTIIIYCSDHGDMANEHGMWWKSCFYNGSVKVPLIISWPEKPRKNIKNKNVVNLIDIGPTILDMAGAKQLPDISGKSFKSLLLKNNIEKKWQNETFSEFCGLLGGKPSCMIRSNEWKFVYYHEFKSFQLFNLEEDPHEKVDRYNDVDCKEIVDGFLQKIQNNWFPEQIMKKLRGKERANKIILKHDYNYNRSIERLIVMKDYNQFDFNQLGREFLKGKSIKNNA